MTSFDLKWTKSEKSVSAKVFGKKKANAQSNNADNPKSEQFTFKKKPKETSNTDSIKNITNKSSNNTSRTLVKRKAKKDKIEAKNLPPEELAERQNAKTSDNKHRSLFSEHHKSLYVNTDIRGASVFEKVFSEEQHFSNLNIHKHIKSNLEKHNFNMLTNVQEKAIPVILTGKNVLIRSQTGSGKTLAYAVPILDGLQSISPRIQRKDGVQAIVIVPTRELALQTIELFGKINTFQWIVTSNLCGGENRNTEKTRLRKGVHILIATPGRLLDHILHTSSFKIDQVKCLVLDEADRLLDMGFKKDLVRIVEELDRAKANSEYDPMSMLRQKETNPVTTHNPVDSFPLRNPNSKARQIILLSATLTKGIAELADFTMKDHVYVDTLDESSKINPDHMVIPDTVKQECIVTFVKHRLFTLSALLVLLSKKNAKVFVFMATSQMVEYHHELFSRYLAYMPRQRGKLKVGDVLLLDDAVEQESEDEDLVLDTEFFKLHGSMNQEERKRVFKAFRESKKGILLCTDVVARGIDVPEADCIIQYTGPQTDEDYLHRVGRTGRAGKSGSALLFLTHEEQQYITRLQEHKVFIKEHKSTEAMHALCELMEETDSEKAAIALQKRYENALVKDRNLYRAACFAYSSWSRFYNAYPTKLRGIFDFKTVNLGHYVTSFAIRDTPSAVAKVVRGQVSTIEPKKLNKKLSNHENEGVSKPLKRKIKSLSLTTSEYSSGLPNKKKKKKN